MVTKFNVEEPRQRGSFLRKIKLLDWLMCFEKHVTER